MVNLFSLGIIFLFLESHAVVINTKQGSLKGLVLESRNGSQYHAFMGIPFAEPPVGQLRFEAPQPAGTWLGVRDATKPSSKCVQKFILIDNPKDTDIGKEDCLYLNVYAPSNIKIQSGLPVIVWIHGGAFMGGTGSQHDPKFFLDHHIVYVTINYRLGAFGFLSAGDEVMPGNYGLKDQIAALKWVHKYIADFGGDPQQVTIIGESAGAGSVHLLMHSPLSTGLFHRAVSQSGSALAPWAQVSPLEAHEKFQAFGILAGCPTESTKVLVNCLKNISAEEIIRIQLKFTVWDCWPAILFPPVKEPASVKDAFLIEDPWNQRVLQDVPWIVGINSAEGTMFTKRLLANANKLAKELQADYKRLLPLTMSYMYWLKNDDSAKITEKLMQYYFGKKEISPETAQEITNLFSDAHFNINCMEAAYRHTNKVYFYLFDHKGEQSFSKIFGGTSSEFGVPHADDLFSFFPLKFNFSSAHVMSSADLQVSNRMVEYWTNFAQTGNPTPGNFWLPSESKDELKYLHIKTDKDHLKTGLLQERYLFWKTLGVHPTHGISEKRISPSEL